FKIQVSGSKIQDSRFKIQDSGDAEVQKAKPRVEQKRKLSFKEKQEFAQLEQDIERLEAEKAQIESALSSGTISVEQITEMSKRLPRLVEELDEKSMRWLELSELA
ncbi:MAG: ABC transporter ATP-binding protein, partial [Bacteroidaceae bacterium]|nr:ABC transporter ATP-binding protein [Bacteroidaceae bacterium]